MSNTEASRTLLLERLESRNLLAGDFFSSGGFDTGGHQGRHHEVNVADVGRHLTDQPGGGHLEPGDQHSLGQPSAGQHSVGQHSAGQHTAGRQPGRTDQYDASLRRADFGARHTGIRSDGNGRHAKDLGHRTPELSRFTSDSSNRSVDPASANVVKTQSSASQSRLDLLAPKAVDTILFTGLNHLGSPGSVSSPPEQTIQPRSVVQLTLVSFYSRAEPESVQAESPARVSSKAEDAPREGDASVEPADADSVVSLDGVEATEVFGQPAAGDESNSVVHHDPDATDTRISNDVWSETANGRWSDELADASEVGGMIEPSIAPSSTREWNLTPLDDNGSANDQPWEVEDRTLDQIREIANGHVEVTEKPSDRVIASWFSGPGGMIAIQADLQPYPELELASSVVDVPLDAVLGSHRTLDLFLGVDASESDGSVRDAVLAAIAGEQSGPIAPIHAPTENRVSSMTYSATALIASVVAMSRRKRQRGELFAHSQKGAFVPNND